MTIDATMLRPLERFDTPTVCNALEMIDGTRRSFGYTRRSLHATNGDFGPVVGVARTATMRSAFAAQRERDELKRDRLDYYEYMYRETDVPKVCVMQDLDGREAGLGPFFGEFNTRIHRAMGFRGIVTDGSVRDVAKLPNDILLLSCGLRPSHGHVHIVNYGDQVNVMGMVVSDGDIVHADEHGAVAFPASYIPAVERNADQFVAAEAPIMEACKRDDVTLEELKRLYLAR
jgi:regulator of RNase E activity RraA